MNLRPDAVKEFFEKQGNLAPDQAEQSLTRLYRQPGIRIARNTIGPVTDIDRMLRKKMFDITEKLDKGQSRSKVQRELRGLAAVYKNSQLVPQILFEAARLEKPDSDDRLEAFLDIAREYPQSQAGVDALLEVGDQYFLRKKFGNALDAYQAHIISTNAKFKHDTALQLKVTYCLLRTRHYNTALDLMNLIDLDNANPRTIAKVNDLKAECLLSLGRFAEAENILKQIIEDHPDYVLSAKILLLRGLAAEENDQTAQARKAYGTILSKHRNAVFEIQAARQRLDAMDRTRALPLPENRTNTTPPEAQKKAYKRMKHPVEKPDQNILEENGRNASPPVALPPEKITPGYSQ